MPTITAGVVATSETNPGAGLLTAGASAAMTSAPSAYIAAQPHYVERELRIYDPADLVTPVVTLEAPVGADWMKQRQDEGSGSLLLHYADADLELLAPGQIARVYIESVPHFQWVLQNKNPKRIEPGEESAQGTQWTGPGIPSILNRGAVAPTLGYNRNPFSDQRVLSFASPEYDATAWGNPTTIVPHWSSFSAYYTGLPDGFPNLAAPWIGPALGTQYTAPIGHWYTIRDFTMPQDGLFTIFVAVDNQAKIYIDGLEFANVSEGATTTSGWATPHTASVLLSAGQHRLAIDITNTGFDPGAPDPGPGIGPILSGNPTALILDAWLSGGNGQLLLRLFQSGTDWLSLEYPDTAPGMTIGQMANIVLDNANRDGSLSYINRTWDDDFDSNGNLWGRTLQSVGLTVGTGLLDVFKTWHAKSYADFSMGVDSYDLNLFRPGEAGTARSVVYEHGVNLTKLEETSQKVGADAVMVRWANGQFLYPTEGGEHISYLEVGKADTQPEAEGIASTVLLYERASGPVGRSQLTAGILPARGSMPGVDFDVDDSISVAGTREDVVQLGGKIDDSRGVAFSLTLRDLVLEWEERVAQAMRSKLNGTLNGDAVSATPAIAPPPFGSKVSASEVQFQLQDNPDGSVPTVPTESPDKRPLTSFNLYAVAVTAKTSGATATTFQFLVNNIDILGGAGILPAGSTYALIPIYNGLVQFVRGGQDVLAVRVTAIGGIDCGNPLGATGLLWEPRFV